MPPLGPQSFSFTVTQLLQNEPGIKLSANLPSYKIHCTSNRSFCDTNLRLHSLANTFPVDILQIGAPLKKEEKKPKTHKNSKVPQGTYILLVLKHTANNLDVFEGSSLM